MKQLNKRKSDLSEHQHYDFSVMKPFLKFSVSAMNTIGHALISIVRNIPKPHHTDDKNGKDRIIKI